MAGAVKTLELDQFANGLSATARDLPSLDYHKPLKAIRVAAIADVKENFAGGHSPEGAIWAPLKWARLRAGNGSSAPLRDTGKLMGSITGQGVGHVEQITGTELTIGTNLVNAAIHQYGGTIRPVNAKALAIPRTLDAFRAGSPRNFPRPLFFGKGPKASYLAETQQKGRGKKKSPTLVIHYLLLKQVTIPARPYLGWSPALLETSNLILQDFVDGEIARRL
jgi:phage gpG-like protein